MRISFLHTAQIHVATFDGILKSLDDKIEVTHLVAPELLAKAQNAGVAAVRHEVFAAFDQLSGADACVCTCSTLGPLTDEYARGDRRLIRIDRPAMAAAVQHGPDVLVALCLQSTCAATMALLDESARAAEIDLLPRVLLCSSAWRHFEAGNSNDFAASIAEQIKGDIAANGQPDCVVLAQASMLAAESRLKDIGVPILSTPLLAAKRAIVVARAASANDATVSRM